MATKEEVLEKLNAAARSDRLVGMGSYGIALENRLGVAMPEIRKIAKVVGKNHTLALELWETGIAEAMIAAALIAAPEQVTETQMDAWVQDFNSWDICDQVCMNLFDKSPLAWKKVVDWSASDAEFVRRAAFALLACLAWHDKKAPDTRFIDLLPVIKAAATDERNMVKKAVSWALRNIGKRNANLHAAALNTARDLQGMDSKSARWIASDAIRDLKSAATLKRVSAGPAP